MATQTLIASSNSSCPIGRTLPSLTFAPPPAAPCWHTAFRDRPLVTFKKSQYIYQSGTEASHVYLLIMGHVRISRISPEGRCIILDILSPGDMFGELALFGINTRGEMAEAMQDAIVCATPVNHMARIVEVEPRAAVEITGIVAYRRHQLELRFEDMAFCAVPVRLARTLLSLAEKYPGITCKGYPYIKLRLTHKDMGEIIGANREIVTASLIKMKQNGTISCVRHWIVLQSESMLREIAGLDHTASACPI